MSDKLTDKLVGGGVKPELSPNPNGSGYTKQVEVDALSSVVNPEENVLYICQGRKYKYLEQAIIDPATNKVLVPSGFVRVDNGPLVHLVKGERGTPVHENVPPQVPPRVFNEPVALNGGVTVKGKKLEDYIDSEGGVTEEELANALALYAKKVDSAQKYVVSDIEAIPSATIALLKVGDIIIEQTEEDGDFTWIVSEQSPSDFVLVCVDNQVIHIVYYYYDATEEQWTIEENVQYQLSNIKGLYMHMLYFNNGKQKCVVYSSSLTPYTFASFVTFLRTLGIYEGYPAYGQYTDGGLKYQITSVEYSGNTPKRIDFRGIMINSTQNITDFAAVNCYADGFTKSVVIEM
jgi:hypothetical protein